MWKQKPRISSNEVRRWKQVWERKREKNRAPNVQKSTFEGRSQIKVRQRSMTERSPSDNDKVNKRTRMMSTSRAVYLDHLPEPDFSRSSFPRHPGYFPEPSILSDYHLGPFGKIAWKFHASGSPPSMPSLCHTVWSLPKYPILVQIHSHLHEF